MKEIYFGKNYQQENGIAQNSQCLNRSNFVRFLGNTILVSYPQT